MITRRRAIACGSLSAIGLALPGSPAAAQEVAGIPASFPTQPPDLVLEMVTVSHFDLARVRELVEARPALARAAWDWGFGDWEDALAAASHTGAREIAGYLIGKGARPTIFAAAMLGQLDVVRAFVAAVPGIQRSVGPHSIRLLAHARAGGPAARAVVEYLEALGDADLQAGLIALTGEEETSLSGVYVFGDTPADRLEVVPTPRTRTAPPRIAGGELSIRRPGHTIRQLFHVGDHAFYPSGAEAVRIRIADTGGRPAVLTVHDPGVVLTATRSPA